MDEGNIEDAAEESIREVLGGKLSEKQLFGYICIIWEERSRIKSKSIFQSPEDVCSLKADSILLKAIVEMLDERYDIDISEEALLLGIEKCKPSSPERKKFKAWIEEQNIEVRREKYEEAICSVCPYSTGFEEGARLVPCGIFSTRVRQLKFPWLCLMTELVEDAQDVGNEQLRQSFLVRLKAEHGNERQEKFLAKEEDLKEKGVRGILETGKFLFSRGGTMDVISLQRNVRFLKQNGSSEALEQLVDCIRDYPLLMEIIAPLLEDGQGEIESERA